MPPIKSPAVWGLAALALGALMAAVDATQPSVDPDPHQRRSAQDTRELLEGTWLREYTSNGVRVRRVLVLEPGGAFREAVRGVDAAGTVTEHLHEGTWLFDGTNLKRKYTLMDSRPPSRLNLPFATFQISFETSNEFVGIDHIHRNKVLYRRVPYETRP
jgi:hypothetical protein